MHMSCGTKGNVEKRSKPCRSSPGSYQCATASGLLRLVGEDAAQFENSYYHEPMQLHERTVLFTVFTDRLRDSLANHLTSARL